MKPLWLVIAAFFVLTGLQASAQGVADFPDRPIRVIILFGPGGSADASTRLVSEELSRELGQPVIVENRPGANGTIAAMAVKNAPADGYTIFLTTNSPLVVNPIVLKDLPYDPVTDFKPLSGIARGMPMFAVSNNSELRTMRDIVERAKKQALSIGSYTAGYQLAAEWFGTIADIDFLYVPYKTAEQMFIDAASGQLDVAIADTAAGASVLQGGKLKALAVSGETRHPELPDVPTIKESGFEDFVNYSWLAMYVRSETPEPITDKLSAALAKVLALDSIKAGIRRKAGLEVMAYPPAEMRSFQMDELRKFQRIAKVAGVGQE